MVELLSQFSDRFARDHEGFLGWFVSPDGGIFCSSDLQSERFLEFHGVLSNTDIVFLKPGYLYFADFADGTFNLDRMPDLVAVPATTLGQEILEAAELVAQMEDSGNDLQDAYMETLDHLWRIHRFCRGDGTLTVFNAVVTEKGQEFNEHREEERSARQALLGLILRFKAGDDSAPISEPDLSIHILNDGEDNTDEEPARTVN